MRIEEETIVRIAQHAATWAYQHIIAHTDVDRPIALSASKDAGDEFARMLVLTLKENEVEIIPRVLLHRPDKAKHGTCKCSDCLKSAPASAS